MESEVLFFPPKGRQQSQIHLYDRISFCPFWDLWPHGRESKTLKFMPWKTSTCVSAALCLLLLWVVTGVPEGVWGGQSVVRLSGQSGCTESLSDPLNPHLPRSRLSEFWAAWEVSAATSSSELRGLGAPPLGVWAVAAGPWSGHQWDRTKDFGGGQIDMGFSRLERFQGFVPGSTRGALCGRQRCVGLGRG